MAPPRKIQAFYRSQIAQVMQKPRDSPSLREGYIKGPKKFLVGRTAAECKILFS